MPYRKINFVNNYFYHLYNRGVAKQPIFLDSQDKFVFLKRIQQCFQINSSPTKQKAALVSIHTFCLMPNHFHLIARQESNNGIISFLRKLGTSYAMYFNKKYCRVGPLFQGRFKAKLIDKDEYIVHLTRYIHLNPLHLVALPEKLKSYPFSSLITYLGYKKIPFLDTHFILGYFKNNLQDLERFVFEKIHQPPTESLKPYLLE